MILSSFQEESLSVNERGGQDFQDDGLIHGSNHNITV